MFSLPSQKYSIPHPSNHPLHFTVLRQVNDWAQYELFEIFPLSSSSFPFLLNLFAIGIFWRPISSYLLWYFSPACCGKDSPFYYLRMADYQCPRDTEYPSNFCYLFDFPNSYNSDGLNSGSSYFILFFILLSLFLCLEFLSSLKPCIPCWSLFRLKWSSSVSARLLSWPSDSFDCLHMWWLAWF